MRAGTWRALIGTAAIAGLLAFVSRVSPQRDRETSPDHVPWSTGEEATAVPGPPVPEDGGASRRVSVDVAPASPSSEARPSRRAPVSAGTSGRAEPRGILLLVLDPRGDPVPDARVEAWPFEGGPMRLPETPPAQTVLTDGEGRCTIPLPAPSVLLVARKEGVGTSRVRQVEPDPSREPEHVLLLQSMTRLGGRVLRSHGAPAAGVRVVVASSGVTVTKEGVQFGRPPSPATTDGEGRFAFELEAASTFSVWAEDEGGKTERLTVVLKPGQTEEVTLRFAGAFSIMGLLADPSGRPAREGVVRAFEKGERWARAARVEPEVLVARTGEDGGFLLKLSRGGEYVVVGSARGFANSPARTIVLEEASPQASVSLVLAAATSIAGRVRGPNGAPLAGASLAASPEGPEGPRLRRDQPSPFYLFGSELSARTGEDGTFRLEPTNPATPYTVTCIPDTQDEDRRVVLREVAPGTSNLEILVTEEILRGVVVEGVVESAEGGGPLPRFRLRLYKEHGDRAWSLEGRERSFEDPRGRFRIEGLLAGNRYGLVAVAEGHATGVVGPWVAEAPGRTFEIRLPKPGGVEVRVVDGLGRGVPRASAGLKRLAELRLEEPLSPAVADPSGIARFERVEPGRYRVHAWLGEVRAQPVEVEVPAGDTAVVEMRLPR
ncbi:MAG: carboxypeptidase-like regulatory domain-containing protein [Planctomycetes bacterium]|nr:carboxypeptidase-like regulatory domain-containing protein [Planctomycetota bacterium]